MKMTLERRGNTFSARGREGAREVRVSLRTQDETEAAARLETVTTVGSLPTLKKAIELYSARPEGIGETETIYLRKLTEALGHHLLVKLGPNLVDNEYTQPRLALVKPGSVRRELAVLQAVLNHAGAFELLKTVPKLRKPRVHDARTRYATVEERDRMIAAAETPEFKAFVAFLFYTAARFGEALEAKPSDMIGSTVVFESRKGRGSRVKRRAVPLHPKLSALLVPSTEWLLPSPYGRRWSESELRRRWADLCDVTKMEDFHLHDCRHSAISHLVMAGVDLITVARISGHSSMSMLARYSHFSSDHLTSAIGNL